MNQRRSARHRRVRTALLLAAALLGACALSPQTVTVQPQLETRPQAIGRGRALALMVRDARPAEAFGTRGGIYDETSFVAPEGDITRPVRAALAGRLSEAGFVVQPPGQAGDIGMEVIIRNIDYSASGKPTVREVETRAVLDVVVTDADRTYRGQSKVSESREVLKAPSPEANEKYLNAVLSRALDRVLAHPDFNKFLNE